MKDSFARNINYLRVSVTDRCNLRCVYCMPEKGVELTSHEDILSFEEIFRAVKAGVKVGIRKIRLTGGEPLVRKDIIDLVGRIAAIPEIDDLAVTTNGILLADMAKRLKEAGLQRVNISLDTLKEDRFSTLTRCGKLKDVMAGIKAAIDVGFDPIKLNSVIMRGFNEDEIIQLAGLSLDQPLHPRFIEVMPIGETADWAAQRHVSSQEILDKLQHHYGPLEQVKIKGSGPAKYYKIPGAAGTIGFIGAISKHFCQECNRLRLTSEGKLRPCLQSPVETDIREALRSGASEEELAAVFREVIEGKPRQHNMQEEDWDDNDRKMSQIGG